jgi:hypothetical protein
MRAAELAHLKVPGVILAVSGEAYFKKTLLLSVSRVLCPHILQ